MNTEENLRSELERLAFEARVQSRSKRPDVALLRISQALLSLSQSLKTSDSPLTSRESEILIYVSQGFTNREIAGALGISEKTIEFHLKSILSKTEASTRAEAVTNAFKLKWLRPT